MWLQIDGGKAISYKSINFTLLKEKLMDGTKDRTTRTNYIPFFEEDEVVVMKFKKRPLFLVPILKYYPKRLSELTLEEARGDGFDSVEEYQDGLMDINNIKSPKHYCFIICWDPSKRVMLDVIKQSGSVWVCKSQNCADLEGFIS